MRSRSSVRQRPPRWICSETTWPGRRRAGGSDDDGALTRAHLQALLRDAGGGDRGGGLRGGGRRGGNGRARRPSGRRATTVAVARDPLRLRPAACGRPAARCSRAAPRRAHLVRCAARHGRSSATGYRRERPVVVSAITLGTLTGAARLRTSDNPRTVPSSDRLTGLDASFLALEKAGAHMHVGSVLVFDGDPPPYDDFARADRGAPAPGPPLPPEAGVPAARAGAPGVGRRSALQHRLPRAPHGAAGAGRRARAAAAGRPRVLPAARPRRSRCGRSGSSTASARTTSRSSARPTTRWSTASRASTS